MRSSVVQLTLLPLDAETRAQLEQLAALPVEMRTEDGSLAWLCPHCDVVVIAEPGDDEASKSDPACSGCRARYHGLTHKQVAALAASGAPPAGPARQVEVVETCDVGACFACARRFGWRQISIVCVRGRRGRGCHGQSVDHCHLHAAAENRGSEDWLGAAGVRMFRDDARSACIVLAGGTGR